MKSSKPVVEQNSKQTAPSPLTETWSGSGQVVYPDGQSATAVDVATYWSSNGKLWDDDGNVSQNLTEEALKEFWINEGTMEAYPQHRIELRAGTFLVETPSKHSCIVLALNADRTLGGIGIATSETIDPIKIVMKPLVRVFGKIRCAGEVPEWTNVYVHYPHDLKEAPD